MEDRHHLRVVGNEVVAQRFSGTFGEAVGDDRVHRSACRYREVVGQERAKRGESLQRLLHNVLQT